MEFTRPERRKEADLITGRRLSPERAGNVGTWDDHLKDLTSCNPTDFKFAVGDKVQHIAFGYNAIIIRKIVIEDADSVDNYYDVGVWESMPPTEGQNIPENQLKAGHRIE